MPIVQQGSINTTALVVPDLYVQIVPPQNLVLNGVPTNVVGMVGTAQWGPVNQAVIVATMADYSRQFGAIQARKYDMGTHVACAVQQGASNFRCVRVTDGTDVAASVVVLTNCITFTALYTGTLGNGITVTISAGSKANTFRADHRGPRLPTGEFSTTYRGHRQRVLGGAWPPPSRPVRAHRAARPHTSPPQPARARRRRVPRPTRSLAALTV